MKKLKGMIFISTLLFCMHAYAAFEMTVARTSVSEGEPVQLYLRQPSGTESIDFSPLYKDFDIVGQRKSYQSHFVNGKGTQTSETVLTLAPKRTGKITLPSLSAGGQTTKPIEITVLTAEETLAAVNAGQNKAQTGSESQPQAQIQAPKVFLRASLSDTSPMEQTPVVYTLRVFTARDVISGNITPPTSKDFEIRQIGDGVAGQETVNGIPYQTEEYAFSIIPLRSGQITVPAAVFSGAVSENDPFGNIAGDDFFDMNDFFMRPPRLSPFLTGRSVTVNSPVLTINALARPENVKGDFFPAQKVTLSEKYLPDSTQIKLGDAVTRTISLQAVGASQANVPQISFDENKAYRQYPAKPEINVTFQGQTPVVEQTRQIVFIPSQAGKVILPSLQIPWYDSVSKTVKTAVLPEKEITVTGASAGTQPPPPSTTLNNDVSAAPRQQVVPPETKSLPRVENQAVSEPSFLKLAADESVKRETAVQREEKMSALMFMAGLFIGAALILAVWFLSRYRFARREKEQMKKSRLLLRRLTEDFKKACVKNNPQKARDALKALAAFYMPDNRNASLSEFAQKTGSEAFINEIDALNNVLYGRGAETWNGDVLFAVFNENKDALYRDLNDESENVVPPLYPV